MTKTKEITIIEKEYFDDLQRIKDTIRTNQSKAMVVVNSAMIMTTIKQAQSLIKERFGGTNILKDYPMI